MDWIQVTVFITLNNVTVALQRAARVVLDIASMIHLDDVMLCTYV